MNLKAKFAQKMLDEKLDFLPLIESIQLLESGVTLETKFHWVMRTEELGDDYDEMTSPQLLEACDEIYGLDNDYALRIGKSYDEFDEFTLELCPAPTYIDLIK